jgi:formamidopyrimidine-DNA glycosylase
MPELPEVETVRRQLEEKIRGKEIESIEVYSPKQTDHDENFQSKLTRQIFNNISRKGKLMVFSFRNQPDLFVLTHLKMTGQLLYQSSNDELSRGGHTMSDHDLDLPNRHTRLQFNLVGGSALYFNDLRKFGYMKITDKAGVQKTLSKFGPEPIDPDFDCKYFYQTIHKSKSPIKAVLLDQSKFAGLGNIYVDEALFRAKVLPSRSANKVSKKESDILCKVSGEVMRESIALGGTTFQHFADTGGQHGNFRDKLQVFGRKGEGCHTCDTPIEKIKLRGRGTHFCPSCQI